MVKKYVCFTAGRGRYGLPVEHVVRIIRREEVIAVPSAPRFVEGVINLRGEVIPVLHLRERFGLPRQEAGRKSRIIIVNSQGRLYGLLVDEVRDIVEVAEEMVDRESIAALGLGEDFVLGIGKAGGSLIVLLDIRRIIASPREIRLQG